MHRLSVGTRTGGHFVSINRDVTTGESICYLAGNVIDTASRFSIQLDHNTHLIPHSIGVDANGVALTPWIYTNHSCSPNCRISGRELVATRTIHSGDEITFDYETSEWDMAEPFHCLCGSPECRKLIRGFKHLDPSVREQLRVNVSNYLLKEMETAQAELA